MYTVCSHLDFLKVDIPTVSVSYHRVTNNPKTQWHTIISGSKVCSQLRQLYFSRLGDYKDLDQLWSTCLSSSRTSHLSGVCFSHGHSRSMRGELQISIFQIFAHVTPTNISLAWASHGKAQYQWDQEVCSWEEKKVINICWTNILKSSKSHLLWDVMNIYLMLYFIYFAYRESLRK